MSQILEKFLAKSRLPEATTAFAGFIAGEAAVNFGVPLPENQNQQPLHEVAALLAGTSTAIAVGGLVYFVRNRRQNT